jgi:hypothetical protein
MNKLHTQNKYGYNDDKDMGAISVKELLQILKYL